MALYHMIFKVPYICIIRVHQVIEEGNIVYSWEDIKVQS